MKAEVAYLLLADGIGPAFTTNEEIDDAYVQALGFDRAYPGLQPPENLVAGVDMKSGLLEPTDASFQIFDVDGTLPQVFAADEDDAEDLPFSVAAGTTAVGASLYGKHVGTEKIGAAGERRRHSCIPGFNVGLEHISVNQASAANGSASPVSDSPVVWAGRRYCLYRLVKSNGSWPDLTDAAQRAAARCHWGALTSAAKVSGRRWTLGAMGVESWMQKTIGSGFSQQPLLVEALTVLNQDANDHVLVGWLDRVSLFDETDLDTNGTYATQTTDDTTLAGATTYDEIAAGMHTFLQAIAGATSGDAGYAFDSVGENDIWYSTQPGADGVHIQWDRDEEFNTISNYYTIRLQVLAHEKVWKALGYDPKVQNSSVDPVEGYLKFGQFEASILDIDYPGHWLGVFYATDPYGMKLKVEGKLGVSDPGQTNNYGAPRRWPPIYAGGASVFDLNQVGQFFRVRTFDPLFLPSSKAVPLPSEPDDPTTVMAITDVGNVTHQGMVVLSGPYRDETNPEAEVTKITLPVRVAWRESSDGSVATDGEFPKLTVYDWPDPKLYGIDEERPTLWAGWRQPPLEDGEPTTMRPLMAIEHSAAADSLSYILARMLATTGSAGGWYSDVGLTTPTYGLTGTAYLDVGPNDLGLAGVGDEGLGAFSDAESFLYGFGIPAEMIADDADMLGSLEAALEEQANDDLFRVKVALGKPASSTEILTSLLAPTGLAISLANGRYGLFDPYKFSAPLPDSGDLAIEDIAGDPGDPTSAILDQEPGLWNAIDEIKLKARLNPVKGDHAVDDTLLSSDPYRLYRAQTISRPVDASHLIHPTMQGQGSDWRPSLADRWRHITRWWATAKIKVRLTVPARRHAEFWPGSPISITNPWLANPKAEVYGVVEAPGYVLRRSLNCKTETIDIDVLVDGSSMRLYAPAARVTEYRANTDGQGHRLFVEDDYLGIRGNSGTFDCEGFVEPIWSDAGGNADVEIWAFDGVTWTKSLYGTVDSVNAEAGNCWIKLAGAPTGGTWYRDHHHLVVLRDADNQGAAWVFEVYAPIGDEDGNYTGSTKTSGFKD